MKFKLIVLTIVILCFVLLIVFFIRPAQKKEHLALYAELIEDNLDTFSYQLFEPRLVVPRVAFWKEDDKIVLNKALTKAIKKGTDLKDEFDLYLAKDKINLDKARLFIMHIIGYNGEGRRMAQVRYYIFDSLPAEIKLPDYQGEDTLTINLNETILKALNVRLTQPKIEFFDVAKDGTLNLSYGDKKFKINTADQAFLGKSEKKISVTREVFAPLPKGEITKEDIKVEKEDFGTITFSTELKVKNFGLKRVVYEQ